jgi:hypothetical protein
VTAVAGRLSATRIATPSSSPQPPDRCAGDALAEYAQAMTVTLELPAEAQARLEPRRRVAESLSTSLSLNLPPVFRPSKTMWRAQSMSSLVPETLVIPPGPVETFMSYVRTQRDVGSMNLPEPRTSAHSSLVPQAESTCRPYLCCAACFETPSITPISDQDRLAVRAA